MNEKPKDFDSSADSGIPDLKARIFSIIQIGNKDNAPSRAFDVFIMVTILVNIAVMFLGTFEELKPYFGIMRAAEAVTVFIFIVEYILRIWTADCLYKGLSRRDAVLRYLFSFDGIIQLLTILPALPLRGFVAFRMLRVVRILHLFRINSYYDSFNVIREVFVLKWKQIASSLFILAVLILASSLCMYGAEHDAQPENFKNAFSGIWWSVSALLTVGYGDIYPITFVGRVMAIIISFLGVGAVAIPTGIISAGFVEQYTKIENPSRITSMDSLFHQVLVDIDSGWIGKSVPELEMSDGILIVLILVDEVWRKPAEGYRVSVGDSLVVFAEKREM